MMKKFNRNVLLLAWSLAMISPSSMAALPGDSDEPNLPKNSNPAGILPPPAALGPDKPIKAIRSANHVGADKPKSFLSFKKEGKIPGPNAKIEADMPPLPPKKMGPLVPLNKAEFLSKSSSEPVNPPD